MTWYKPWEWGKPKTKDENAIYCDNPQCGKPIKGDEFAFDAQRQTLYHPECAMMACALEAFNSKQASVMNVEYIGREDALRIDAEKKAGGLEKKVE